MTFNHLGDRLAAYVDGELPRVTRELVSTHLGMCAACRAAVAEQARTKQGLTELQAPDPSTDLLGSLLQMAEPDQPLPPRRQPFALDAGAGPGPLTPRAGFGVASVLPGETRRSRMRRSMLAAGALGIAAVTMATAHVQNATREPVPAADGGERTFAGVADTGASGPAGSSSRFGSATSTMVTIEPAEAALVYGPVAAGR